ncbi:PAS domain S-box protein [Roseomonas tokyonensis]|nr:PAS domain S-box protein [Falsiroseomonas tokyonensis]
MTPWHHPDGSIGGAVLFSEVVTERNRANQALRESEARLRSILATVPSAMIIIDDQGTIESFSVTAERMFGCTAAYAVGRNISMLMPEPDRTRHDSYLARYRETGKRHIIGTVRTLMGRRLDGSEFPMELSVGEVEVSGRRLFTGFIQDQTEREGAQRQLQTVQDELLHVSRLSAAGEMASTLAHELHQPLTAIATSIGAAKRLLAGTSFGSGEDGPVQRKVLEALERAAAQSLRGGQIIRRLREFVAKGESEHLPEDIGRLIEETRPLILAGVRSGRVQVSFHLEPGLKPVLIDRIQIQQVILNLTRNAAESMDEGGALSPMRNEVRVGTRTPEEGWVEVSVADRGPGLAPEVATKLFTAFVSTKAGGMGVGLSICRTIVEAHGGRIWAMPNPDGGTVFRFTLPTMPPETCANVDRITGLA